MQVALNEGSGDIPGFVRAIMDVEREIERRSGERRVEEANKLQQLAAEVKATIRALKPPEIAEFVEDRRRKCGRPTATESECQLECESFAIACKWHMTIWERNTHLIAQQAFFAGMDAR